MQSETDARGPVLIAYDGSDNAKAAIAQAGRQLPRLQELCEHHEADLVVIGSSHRSRIGEVLAGSVGQRLLHGSTCPVAIAPSGSAGPSSGQAPRRKGLEAVSGEIEASGALLRGDPAEELSKAGVDAGLLVLGSRAYGPLRSVLLGSVSAGLVRAAPCPVMVFPRGAHETERTRVGTLQQDTRSPEGNDA